MPVQYHSCSWWNSNFSSLRTFLFYVFSLFRNPWATQSIKKIQTTSIRAITYYLANETLIGRTKRARGHIIQCVIVGGALLYNYCRRRSFYSGRRTNQRELSRQGSTVYIKYFLWDFRQVAILLLHPVKIDHYKEYQLIGK